MHFRFMTFPANKSGHRPIISPRNSCLTHSHNRKVGALLISQRSLYGHPDRRSEKTVTPKIDESDPPRRDGAAGDDSTPLKSLSETVENLHDIEHSRNFSSFFAHFAHERARMRTLEPEKHTETGKNPQETPCFLEHDYILSENILNNEKFTS